MSATITTLIVCEQHGDWAAALRRAFATAAVRPAQGTEYRLIETRGAVDCREATGRWPAATVVIELRRESCDEALELLYWVNRSCPATRCVVVADRTLDAYRWLARELGAIHFSSSPRQLEPVVDLARRHAGRMPKVEHVTAVDRIWNSLPWS